MVRAFLAVEIPPDLRASLWGLSAGLERLPVKRVEAENIHITLKFLGELPEERLARVEETLVSLSLPTFEARLEGVGAFPTPRRPRVVWVG
ncbi:MAG: RNA 2',3'-cyclic phosphodiesterase, partial [Euryarchaeota archaeon]|nr:RNA 2',3'-cyclic phosphodiesterase [Euryarchaeota archaeon]